MTWFFAIKGSLAARETPLGRALEAVAVDMCGRGDDEVVHARVEVRRSYRRRWGCW